MPQSESLQLRRGEEEHMKRQDRTVSEHKELGSKFSFPTSLNLLPNLFEYPLSSG